MQNAQATVQATGTASPGSADAPHPARPRGLLVDVALGCAVAVVLAVAIAADLGGERRPDIVAYLFAAGLGALMLVRRQFPVLALIATGVGLLGYYAAGYPSIGLAIPVAGALYSAAEAGRLRWAIGVGLGLLIVSMSFRVAEGESLAFLFGYELAATAGLMASVVALGDGVRARRLWHAGERERARQAAAAREREAVRRVEAERLRIARDLHDVLGHTLSVVTLHADVAGEALPDDPDAVAKALRNIRAAGGEAMRELRTTVGLLRAPADDGPHTPAGSLSQLDKVVEAAGQGGMPVTVTVEGRPVALPAVVDATAYRIVQESLTNALRHAHATHAELALHYTEDRLHISVTDNGRGSSAAEVVPGHGVTGMQERAALLGGSVRAGGRAEGGFGVEASLPLAVRS